MAEEAKKKKNKKVNKMKAEDIDAKLKELKEKTGGHSSRYAKQLLLHKGQ